MWLIAHARPASGPNCSHIQMCVSAHPSACTDKDISPAKCLRDDGRKRLVSSIDA